MKIDIAIRQSDLEAADKCLEAVRYNYREPVPEPYTSDLARGNVVHAVIEVVGNHMLAHGEPTPIDEIEPVLAAAMEREFSKVDEWRHPESEVAEIVRANFDAWYWGVAPDLTPAAVEHQFRVLLDEDERRRIWLTGTMDWLDADGRIIDWKNPSRPYQAWEKVRWDNQSGVYSYAVASETDDWSPRTFQLCMLVNGAVHWITIERGPNDWNALRDKCRALADLIQSDLQVWPQSWNSWYCSPKWCPAWDRCRGKHYPEGEPW